MNYKKHDAFLEYAIIEYFKKEKDNRTSVIANHFNVSFNVVSRVIDEYLKSKIKQKLKT